MIITKQHYYLLLIYTLAISLNNINVVHIDIMQYFKVCDKGSSYSKSKKEITALKKFTI